MSPKPKRDLIADHQEWIDHMYNRGYWINRVSWANIAAWRWTRRHNRLAGGLMALGFGLPLALAIQTVWEAINLDGLAALQGDWPLILQTLVLAVLFATGLVLFFQRPLVGAETSPHPPRRMKRKRLPKHRKDYR